MNNIEKLLIIFESADWEEINDPATGFRKLVRKNKTDWDEVSKKDRTKRPYKKRAAFVPSNKNLVWKNDKFVKEDEND